MASLKEDSHWRVRMKIRRRSWRTEERGGGGGEGGKGKMKGAIKLLEASDCQI